ncbi:MAG: DUF1127 domain-containing protein [Thalassovita sp.]
MSQQTLLASQIISTDLGLNAPVAARLAFVFAVTLTKWHLRYHTRKALKNMTNTMLLDIGLTRDAAYTEARRPFWRA